MDKYQDNLCRAIRAGDESEVLHLLRDYDRKMWLDGDGVIAYVYLENPAMLRLVVHAGINIDEHDSAGSTVLMSVAAHGRCDLVKWLVEHGANINAKNDDGETPFSFACAWDQVETAMLLHDLGADLNCVHNKGGTPLDDGKSSERIRSFLISIGAKRESELESPSDDEGQSSI